MTKSLRCVALLGAAACGGADVEGTTTPAPQPVPLTTAYSNDGLFFARWVEGQGELRLTRSATQDPGCRSASYRVEVLGAAGGGPLELGYDRRNLETRLRLGWARIDGATTERLSEPTLTGPGVIRVSPTPSTRYCAVGPEPLQPIPDPESARAPVGSGRVYALNGWRIAGAGQGLEDGAACAAEPCPENSLAFLGSRMNDVIRQHVLGGTLLQLIEVVGLDDLAGPDAQWVLKPYLALDADDPFRPANNFRPAEGAEDCCEFLVAGRSLESGQARAIAGGTFDEGVARTTADSTYDLVLEVGDGFVDTVITLQEVRWRFWIHPRPSTIEGHLTGVAPISQLAVKQDLGCQGRLNCGGSVSLTWLDTVAARVQPDRDRDGDGLESVFDADGDGHIDHCCDGPLAADGRCRPGEEVPPLVTEDPDSCAQQPEMADGYSLTMAFEGVSARIVGVEPTR